VISEVPPPPGVEDPLCTCKIFEVVTIDGIEVYEFCVLNITRSTSAVEATLDISLMQARLEKGYGLNNIPATIMHYPNRLIL
jgi:hypothetical protein